MTNEALKARLRLHTSWRTSHGDLDNAPPEGEINRLRRKEAEAHRAIATLDSERAANALLTEQIERLEAENERLRGANQAAAECVAAMMEECARYRAEIQTALEKHHD